MPAVSIVLPTYNAVRYLPESISSVLSQSFEDFELLVLDNASTDETGELVSAVKDGRLRYVRNETNLGFTRNLALGLTLARGEYVAQIGADDVWHSAFLQKTVEVLDQNPSLSFVHSNVFWVDGAGRAFGESASSWPPFIDGSEAFVRIFRNGFCFSTLLMRNSSICAAGGVDANWSPASDLGLVLRLCLQGPVGFIQDRLGWYRIHSHNMTSGCYSTGTFRYEMEMLDHVLASTCWNDSQKAAIREASRREIALRGIQTLHAAGSATAALKQSYGLFQLSSLIAIQPQFWARLILALSPPASLRILQGWRRRKGIRKYDSFSPPPIDGSQWSGPLY